MCKWSGDREDKKMKIIRHISIRHCCDKQYMGPMTTVAWCVLSM